MIILLLIRALNKAIDTAQELAAISDALRERTATLFTELQHRVANNLMFVSSILHHQRRLVARGGSADQALADAQERILTMSRIHRHLYDPVAIDQPGRIHLDQVCGDLIRASGMPVTYRIEADETFLSLEQLIPATLIVSELVTNCLKHAFNNQDSGEIIVRLQQQADGTVLLQVADNGCGEGPGTEKKGLGAVIVQNLANQLHGHMKTEHPEGTVVSLIFPRVARDERRALSGVTINPASRCGPNSSQPLLIVLQRLLRRCGGNWHFQRPGD